MTNRPLTSEVRSHVPADTLLASAHAVNIASTNVIQKNRVILRGFRAPRRPRNPMARLRHAPAIAIAPTTGSASTEGSTSSTMRANR